MQITVIFLLKVPIKSRHETARSYLSLIPISNEQRPVRGETSNSNLGRIYFRRETPLKCTFARALIRRMKVHRALGSVPSLELRVRTQE